MTVNCFDALPQKSNVEVMLYIQDFEIGDIGIRASLTSEISKKNKNDIVTFVFCLTLTDNTYVLNGKFTYKERLF
ncbi:hypothetical protein D1818_24720 [Aquimarina sp. BL5]|uniref:hypothetical protein n=1 Tax=Aquimarina sp. BL5 TaxID=1714860 RepID=UPI000E4830F1|nr:hypothetical protein [Aquimarina sp. BL5]AXT53864.1 hypothetical protein D1818_24720 [Aquimarina sp. BL5]RKN04663.1 hypothetical protein D7036_11825 [Aquimarina sp. BL5]